MNLGLVGGALRRKYTRLLESSLKSRDQFSNLYARTKLLRSTMELEERRIKMISLTLIKPKLNEYKRGKMENR